MATMVPPELLLLDEHTAALDPGTAEKVLELTQADRGGGTYHLPDGNAQHAAGFGAGDPDIDDG
ncbi:MAG: hypothetical protein ACLU38_12570 [Dysosmobacter sp.]